VIGHAPLKFYYASQVGTNPPRFLLFVNDKAYCADNYLAYLNNSLREAFDFTGFPIRVELRSRPKKVESLHTPARTAPKSSAVRSKARSAARPNAAKSKVGKTAPRRKNKR